MTTATGSTYSLDTSALLDGLERYYPESTFPALWERMDELMAQGRLLMSEEAWLEAQAVDAPAKVWCVPRKDRLVVVTDPSIAVRVTAMASDYPTWTVGTTNRADPFVIAVAQERSAIVVTGEKSGSVQNPKIPFVCAVRGVECINFLGLIRSEGWVFG